MGLIYSKAKSFLNYFPIIFLAIIASILITLQQFFILFLILAIVLFTVIFQNRPLLSVVIILCFWTAAHIFLLNWDFGINVAGYPLSVSRLIGVFLVFEGMLWLLKKENLLFLLHSNAVVKFYFLFCAYALLRIFGSPHIEFGLIDFIRLLSGFIILIVVAKGFRDKRELIKPSIDAILIAAVIGAALTIISLFSMKFNWGLFGNIFDRVEMGTFRSKGIITSSGGTSALFQILTGIALYYYCFFRSRKYLIFIVLYCIAIFATSSRSGILGILIVFTLWAVLEWRRGSLKNFFTPITILVLVVVLGVSLLSYDVVRVRLSDIPFIGVSITDESMGLGRLLLWKASFKFYSELSLLQKLFGSGLSYFNSLTFTKLTPSLSNFLEKAGAHNDFLDILLKMGLCGLIMYILWIVSILKICLEKDREFDMYHDNYLKPIILITFVSYIISQMMVGVSFYLPGHRWFMLLFLGLLIS